MFVITAAQIFPKFYCQHVSPIPADVTQVRLANICQENQKRKKSHHAYVALSTTRTGNNLIDCRFGKQWNQLAHGSQQNCHDSNTYVVALKQASKPDDPPNMLQQ